LADEDERIKEANFESDKDHYSKRDGCELSPARHLSKRSIRKQRGEQRNGLPYS
jgi:hypothetical protein